MTRREEWEIDVQNMMRPQPWTLTGSNRLVKVYRYGEQPNYAHPEWKVGYVTQERYLLGKSPPQLERVLGLPPFRLRTGCRVFRLERLPQLSEYTDELTANHPGGLAFDVGDAFEARAKFMAYKGYQEVPYYPPGSPHIPQWNVTVPIRLIHLFNVYAAAFYPAKSV